MNADAGAAATVQALDGTNAAAPETAPETAPESRQGLFEQRLLLALPLPPALGGALVSAVAFLASGLPNLLYHEAFASAAARTPMAVQQGYFTDEGTWTALVWSLLLGYVLAAFTLLPARAVADTLRTLDHLPPELATRGRFTGLRASTVRRSRIVGGVWALLGLLGLARSAWLLLAPASFEDFVLPFLVRFAWFIVVVPYTCFVIGRAAYVSLRTSRAGEREMLQALRFHVLDPSPFDGLVRMTLRSAAAWIGGATIISLFLFNVPWRYLGATIPLALAACAMAGVVVGAPLVGINHRMRELKRAELARVLREIERDRALLAEQGDGGAVGADIAPRLTALLAYREAVSAAPEWPLDVSNGGRIVLLVVLPVLGWIAAALVERMLSIVI